jgi:hypothetical protein
MSYVTEFNRLLSFEISVSGRKRDALLRLLDPHRQW